ncbi:MAG: threonine ammonia-lyase [Actinomycetota bacterium]
MAEPLVSIGSIRTAREALIGVIRPTPVDRIESLSGLAGRPIMVKPEYRQVTGSYKIRGAYNLIRSLEPGQAVVAASAGNHAQGVARAARLTDRRATIFMPRSAALPKIQATRADGAQVELVDGIVDDAIRAARQESERSGSVFVHPFDDAAIIAGQGTVGLELLDDLAEDVTIVVPVGGGGLISGIATAVRDARPAQPIIGVEAQGAPAMRFALDSGEPLPLGDVSTIADGIAVQQVSQRTLDHVRALVNDVVTVGDDSIGEAFVLLLERAKAVVEPAGAAALAAVLSGKIPGDGPVCCVLSGGNVDPIMLTRLVEHGLSAAGRYLVLRVVVEDRPGALANLTAVVAELGLNVHSVEHHRVGLRLGLDKVEVLLTLETRDPTHRDETVAELGSRGYQVEPMS